MQFKGCKVLVIDEMSMLTCKMLNDIDKRMRHVCQNTSAPFGGMCVLLMGDFVQIPPVGGGDLYVKTPNTNSSAQLDALQGYNTFRTFTIVNLVTQHRARDHEHMLGIAAFRDWTLEGLLEREKFLHNLQHLSPIDVQTDPAWHTALIVSTDRKTVHQVNEAKLRMYAISLNKPIFRWKLPFNVDFTARLTPDLEQRLYTTVKDLWAYAVEGAPITLTYNIRPERGLSNGTQGNIHSLVLSAQDAVDTTHNVFRGSAGDYITLTAPPTCVNITVPQDSNDGVALGTTLNGDRIVPIFPIPRDVNLGRYIPLEKKRKGVVAVSAHPFQLLFATTFHGVQCRTLDKIILCVDHPITPPLSYNAFYVGISRVRLTADIRLVQLRSTDDHSVVLRRLRSLMPRAQLVHYMAHHPTMPYTFKYLRETYHRVGILYDQKGADKVIKSTTCPVQRYNCRKGCSLTFDHTATRNTHEATCQHAVEDLNAFPCSHGCGRTWAKDSHRKLHERRCKAATSSAPDIRSIITHTLDSHLQTTASEGDANTVLDTARQILSTQDAHHIERVGKQTGKRKRT